MFRRIVFTALLAGIAAGIALSAVQTWRVTPIILQAETYENDHSSQAQSGHDHSATTWAPEDGIERALYTLAANILTAIGFALLLASVYALRNHVDWLQGLLWGVAGYLVFFVFPGLGIHPEIPGAPAADLDARQAWWLLTIVCSGLGLALLVLQKKWLWKGVGGVALVVPHVLGAPQPESAAGLAPQELASAFVIASALANAVFWLVLGAISGFVFKRLA